MDPHHPNITPASGQLQTATKHSFDCELMSIMVDPARHKPTIFDGVASYLWQVTGGRLLSA